MSQRSSHSRIAEMTRLVTVTGLLRPRGELLIALALISLPLVLLITNGGAG